MLENSWTVELGNENLIPACWEGEPCVWLLSIVTLSPRHLCVGMESPGSAAGTRHSWGLAPGPWERAVRFPGAQISPAPTWE